MSYTDFKDEFMRLEICYLGPDTLEEEGAAEVRKWEGTLHEGSWRRYVNAGGCANNKSSWYLNGFCLN